VGLTYEPGEVVAWDHGTSSSTNDPSVRAPVAVRLANQSAEAWIVAAGPRHPDVDGPPSLATVWMGFEEILILFERTDATALRLTGQ
jgi:hypothetical protein